MSMKWYVLRTRTSKEFKVKEIILKGIKGTEYEDLVEEIRIPTQKTYQIRDGKKIEKEKKLFSSYVIIKANLTKTLKNYLVNIPNVSTFLGAGKKPLPLSEKEVENLDGLAGRETGNSEKYKFVPGDIVEINSGPFEGFEGLVKSYDPENGMLTVEVTVFGKITPVEVSGDQVEKKE